MYIKRGFVSRQEHLLPFQWHQIYIACVDEVFPVCGFFLYLYAKQMKHIHVQRVFTNCAISEKKFIQIFSFILNPVINS